MGATFVLPKSSLRNKKGPKRCSVTVHATFAQAIITDLVQYVPQVYWWDFHVYCLAGNTWLLKKLIPCSWGCVCVQRPELGGGFGWAAWRVQRCCQSTGGFLFEHVYLALVQNPTHRKDWGGVDSQRLNYSMFCSFFIEVWPRVLTPHHVEAHTDSWHCTAEHFCRWHCPHLVEKHADTEQRTFSVMYRR